jgi:acetolactate synthase I/II/III large subunit
VNGARLLIDSLVAEGCDLVFGYPGGAIMPVYDALVGAPLRHILVRHEQAAVFAADGYARATGRVGVCMATSGPGATNLVTGIANAYMDSIPLVAITGQVPTTLMGTDAFQEVDTLGITMPVVKHGWLVRRPEDIPELVAKAFQVAASGRPGPVLLDLPKDVAAAAVEGARREAPTPLRAACAPSDDVLDQANELLARSVRPVVYAGGGVALAGAVEALRRFVARTDIPVVGTLKGLGVLPPDDPCWLGMLGMHGTRAANLAVQTCDLLLCVGARFDDRATGKLASFAPGARVIHLDVDPSEVGKLRRADVVILGDLVHALERLRSRPSVDAWRCECRALGVRHAFRYDAPGNGVYAPALLHRLSREVPDAIVTCDVGQHQMWVAQHWRVANPDHHLSSGGLGAMGYGLPAAIGACLGRPDTPVIAVTGDGSIMMNVQELATIRRYDLPIRIVLLDNAALGMVRQWQELFFAGRYSEVDLSDNPDFVAVAQAFGIPAFRVQSRDEVEGAISHISRTQGPLLVHVKIDPLENVWPLVPPGASNSEMLESGKPCAST